MLLTSQKDQILLKNFINGDNDSFEILLERYKNRLFAFIISKVKDRDLAEDIFQETMIKVINSLKRGNYNEEGKFLPWIMRIAHNLVIDYFRKKAKIRDFSSKDDYNIFDFLDSGEIDQQDVMIKKQIFLELKNLINELPNDQRKVLKLRYFEEMSFKKISRITGVSINTALGRMRYALINIRKIANEKNIDLYIK